VSTRPWRPGSSRSGKQERKDFLGSFPGLDEPLVKSLGSRGENRQGEGRRELRLLTGAFPTLGTLAVTTTVMRKAAA
jgi:hypothetical protein